MFLCVLVKRVETAGSALELLSLATLTAATRSRMPRTSKRKAQLSAARESKAAKLKYQLQPLSRYIFRG